MEVITFLWQQYLYLPLFNLLILLYLNYSFFNLGIAIILLTLIVRVVLLPFSILTEKNKIVSQRLRKEISSIKKDFENDPVQQKEMIRSLLRKRKIRPWAKAIVLGVQGLILLLLYQVFVGGINTKDKIHLIYPSIPRPDFINTKFLWFDISEHNLLMAAIVAGFIFSQMLISSWGRRKNMSKKEQMFMVLFPLLILVILAALPSAKSIFVLTSAIFSSIISMFTILIKRAIKQANPQQK